jgi:hypothetical protein
VEISSGRHIVRKCVDNSVPEVKANPKKLWGGNIAFNQSVLSQSRFAPSTFYDKGLFDTREIGYTY